ncbi:MAG: hypothetical protein LQ346_003067 [Caloplaca aetnensis]|nr:MAG: hypothetical protein LQ346_003067 [Caloplaca aetnensis]
MIRRPLTLDYLVSSSTIVFHYVRARKTAERSRSAHHVPGTEAESIFHNAKADWQLFGLVRRNISRLSRKLASRRQASRSRLGAMKHNRDRVLTWIEYIDVQTFGGYNEQESSYRSMQHNVTSYKGKLDPRDFYVRVPPNKFFVEGRVFIKLHTEDAGTTTGDRNSFGFSIVSYGELAYSQLRRFVVVKAKPKENYCLCIPILTYSGKGAGKKGVDQKAHAIIYTGGDPPERLATEVGMNKTPIRVIPSRADEKLDPVSRVNMGKMFTVEWNTKVKDIGLVDKSSLVRLLAYWRQIINT